MPEYLPAPLQLALSLFDWADRVESEAKKIFGELNAASAIPAITSCGARAAELLRWNGQSGGIIEVLIDQEGLASCRLIQTGISIDDALIRSLTDGALEPKSGRALERDFKASRSKSQYVWLTPDLKAITAGGPLIGYGAFLNRSQATQQLMRRITTTDHLTPARNWRQLREIQSLSLELQRRTDDQNLKTEIAQRSAEMISQKAKMEQLTYDLNLSIAKQRMLTSANNDFTKILDIAVAIGQIVAAIGPMQEQEFKDEIISAKSHKELNDIVVAKLNEFEKQISKTQRALIANAMDQNNFLSWFVDILKQNNAPLSSQVQPRWNSQGTRLEREGTLY